LQMTTHVTTALLARLPVPRPRHGTLAHAGLGALAIGLSARDSIEGSAAEYAGLNAIVANLYGLTQSQYEHVVSTFPLLPESLRVCCLERFAAVNPGLAHPRGPAAERQHRENAEREQR